MTPDALVALANLPRRRRGDTTPRTPFVTLGRARQALAEDGLSLDGLTGKDLPALARLADAASRLGDDIALHRAPASQAVAVINELASGCSATARLEVRGRSLRGVVDWRDPDPVAGLARRVIDELSVVDTGRLRQCGRAECDLLFFDLTRSRSQRWHAENPCGWLERQHRRRSPD